MEPRTSSEDDIISVMMVTTTCHFNASTGRLATWDSTFLDLFQVILFLFIFLILLIVFDYITFILTMALFLFLKFDEKDFSAKPLYFDDLINQTNMDTSWSSIMTAPLPNFVVFVFFLFLSPSYLFLFFFLSFTFLLSLFTFAF